MRVKLVALIFLTAWLRAVRWLRDFMRHVGVAVPVDARLKLALPKGITLEGAAVNVLIDAVP